jgi:hypothetical protein
VRFSAQDRRQERLGQDGAPAAPLRRPRLAGSRSTPPLSSPRHRSRHSTLRSACGGCAHDAQTIIETCKMGTTGDLPPNCKGGQAFINDPNALGTSEARDALN